MGEKDTSYHAACLNEFCYYFSKQSGMIFAWRVITLQENISCWRRT